MGFRLIESGWQSEIDGALNVQKKDTAIICPFIKYRVAERMLARADARSMRVITRFNLEDFANGVSDISALTLMQSHGAQIRGIKNLHAKLYVFGDRSVILTSANLTGAGLLTNHEFGCFADEPHIVEKCRSYFSAKWIYATPAKPSDFSHWQAIVTTHHAASGDPSLRPALPDHGANQPGAQDGGILPHNLPTRVSESERSFVKFFGTNANRADRSLTVLDEVSSSTSHAVLSYPLGKRPRQIKDGDTVFIGRLVRNPNDIMIYGRATGMEHDETRDNASQSEILRRPWRADWPHYIRVHHAEFMRGTLDNAIPMGELMDALGHKSFAATLRNYQSGTGNVNPRHAFQQKPSVQLAPAGTAWLNERMTKAFQRYGTLSAADLDAIK